MYALVLPTLRGCGLYREGVELYTDTPRGGSRGTLSEFCLPRCLCTGHYESKRGRAVCLTRAMNAVKHSYQSRFSCVQLLLPPSFFLLQFGLSIAVTDDFNLGFEELDLRDATNLHGG